MTLLMPRLWVYLVSLIHVYSLKMLYANFYMCTYLVLEKTYTESMLQVDVHQF